MDIDTGDNSPIYQRPYNLPLNLATWAQKELKLLEKAGIIWRNVSPWTSSIVIVPKGSAYGEPPRQCLCIDCHALNKLLTPVTKAHSKA